MDFLKIYKYGLRLTDLKKGSDIKEECISKCFLAIKGTTDQQYCIEKCGIEN